MAFCLPRSFNIPGPRIRADKIHATPEMWELSCYAGAIWGLLLGICFQLSFLTLLNLPINLPKAEEADSQMASSMSSQSESQESSIWPHKHYPSFSEGHGYCGAPSSCQPRSRTSPLPCLCSPPPIQHEKLRINKSSCHRVG